MTASRRRRGELELQWLDKLYELMEPGREYRDMSADRVGELVGTSNNTNAEYAARFEQLGILKRERVWGSQANGFTTGRHYHWTLLVPHDEARDKVVAEQEKRHDAHKEALRKPRPRTQVSLPAGTEARANERLFRAQTITDHTDAGPARTLVQDARDYLARQKRMLDLVDELERTAEDHGAQFDRATVLGALGLGERNTVYETIALVLPYIDRLEGRRG